jgi:hypothetical protein
MRGGEYLSIPFALGCLNSILPGGSSWSYVWTISRSDLRKIALPCLAVLVVCSAAASGAVITQSRSFGGIPDFQQALTFDSFDTALGTLLGVTIWVDVDINSGQALVDNESDSLALVNVNFSADATASSAGEVFFPNTTAVATVSQSLQLDPDNGDGNTIDPTAPDGATVPLTASGSSMLVLLASAGAQQALQVATFEDTLAGADYDILVDSSTVFQISGASGVAGGFTPANVAGEVIVQYTYVPEPATMSLLTLGGAVLLKRRRK